VIPRVPIDERTVEDWDRVMAVNARGVFLGTKHAIPAMRRAGGGSIVNISSIAGIGQSLHQEPAYAASKGAVRIFTKVTASLHALQLNITSLIDTQTREQQYGIEHLAVDTDDYPATLARLRANGVRVLEELTPTNGRRVCFLEAPDGAQVELIEKK